MHKQDNHNLNTISDIMNHLSDIGIQYRSNVDVSKALNVAFYSLGVVADQIIKKMARDDELEAERLEQQKKQYDVKKSQ